MSDSAPGRLPPREQASVGRSALHFGQGLLMGAADVIPGVSGGTVALIVGIYERLILSISALASLPATVIRSGWTGLRATVASVYWEVVLPLGVGIVGAFLVGARVIPGLLDAYPVESRAVFFGLIAGSLVVPWRRIPGWRPALYVAVALAAAVVFLIVGIPPRTLQDPSFVTVFLVASIAISAMILPGVSGAFLLFVMGMYEVALRALGALDIPFIVVFGLGAAFGLGVFSKVLGYLLVRHHDITMAILIGLMLGGLRGLWPYLGEHREMHLPPAEPSTLWVFLLMAACALFVILVTGIGLRRRRVRTGEVD